MTEQEYKRFFSQSVNPSMLVDEILKPILGEFKEDKSTNNYAEFDDYKDNARKAHVDYIKKMGEFETKDTDPVLVFDIILNDACNVSIARKNIQGIVRAFMETCSGAFLIFHYGENSRRADKDTWRLSWVKKEKSDATTTSAKRYTYLCGPSYACRTIAKRFEILQDESSKTLDTITKAFDVEALSDEFFKEYKVMYDDIVQWITGQRIIKKDGKWKEEGTLHTGLGDKVYKKFYNAFGKDDKIATKAVRDYVKKLLGRLVFIQFLQKKGCWLKINGYTSTNFLLDVFNQVSTHYQDDFIEKVLEKVVYLLLNNENRLPDSEKIGELVLDVPFLNGGLFEPDVCDDIVVQLPKEFFHNEQYQEVKREQNETRLRDNDNFFTQCGILDLLNQYNFTIDENDPDDAEVGVDPEMLGKIFENLLEDNKEKGAFYTPKEIVQYMCNESLIAYLQSKVPNYDDEIRQFVLKSEKDDVPEKEKILNAIKEVKICDPAVGSGAFPMGLLNLLVALREKLEPGTNRCNLKKEIIQNNIYGVDIEKGAIDIARLRFWLSIMVDDEGAKPTPLPNFEYKFMQGNSLFTTFDLQYVDIKQAKQNVTITKQINDKKKELLKKKSEFYGLSGEEKYKKEVEIKLLVVEILKLRLGFEKGSVDQQDTTKQMVLFAASDMPQNSKSKKKIQEVKAAQDRVRRLIEKLLEIEKQLNDKTKLREERAKTDILFFDWEICFSEIFPQDKPEEERGFDIVIGNPPYFNVETLGLHSSYAETVKKEYSSIWQDKSDILFYFFGLALNLSNNIVCYITSNAYLFSDKAKKLRNQLIDDCRLERIVNFEEFMVFNDASITTCITMMSKNLHEFSAVNVKGKNYTLKTVLEYIQNPKNAYSVKLKKDSVFALVEDYIDTLNNIIDGSHDKLNSLFEIGSGMQTGANGVFRFSKYPIGFPDDVVKCRMTGEIIKKYIHESAEEYLLYVENYNNFNDLPKVVQDHLNKNKSLLCNRAQIKRSNSSLWWKYVFPMHKENYSLCKIWCSYRSKTNTFALDESNEFIGLTNTTVIFDTNKELSLKYLLALLNSRVLSFRYKSIGKQTGGGVFEFFENGVGKLPIPFSTENVQKSFVALVDKILISKKSDPQTDTTALERKIDILVYLLYGLTWDDVQIVENSL